LNGKVNLNVHSPSFLALNGKLNDHWPLNGKLNVEWKIEFKLSFATNFDD